MDSEVEKTADELHEEIYGKQDTAPVPYIEGEDEVTPPAPVAPVGDDYEHKYKVLSGKYNTEVQRQNEMLAQAFSDKARLEYELAQIKQAPPANVFSDDITTTPEEDIEFFAREYPNVFKGATALLKKELAKVEQRVESVGEIAQRTGNEKYLESMDQQVKDWQVINKDPNFIAWLQQPVRYTNVPKKQLLMEAFNSRNAQATAQFFQDFLAETGANPPPADTTTGTTTTTAASRDLSPSTSGNPTPSTQAKGTVTREDISRFYKDRAEGRYVGTEEDAAKVESRFLKAVREGKVR